jgi:hypothetical protein
MLPWLVTSEIAKPTHSRSTPGPRSRNTGIGRPSPAVQTLATFFWLLFLGSWEVVEVPSDLTSFLSQGPRSTDCYDTLSSPAERLAGRSAISQRFCPKLPNEWNVSMFKSRSRTTSGGYVQDKLQRLRTLKKAEHQDPPPNVEGHKSALCLKLLERAVGRTTLKCTFNCRGPESRGNGRLSRYSLVARVHLDPCNLQGKPANREWDTRPLSRIGTPPYPWRKLPRVCDTMPTKKSVQSQVAPPTRDLC